MKTLLLLYVLAVAPMSLFAQKSYADSLILERQIHDERFFKEVLNEEEKKHVGEICYFPVDTNYIVEATFTAKKGKRFVMPMSKERVVYYRSVGTLQFTIRDTLCTLQLFKNLSSTNKELKNYYFLPYRDGTSAITTYGGGKYIDIVLTKEQFNSGKVIIDFNTSYHPYCAYSERYSCPIVDAANRIAPLIEAGECYTLNHDDESSHRRTRKF